MAACLFLARIPANQQSLGIRGWSFWNRGKRRPGLVFPRNGLSGRLDPEIPEPSVPLAGFTWKCWIGKRELLDVAGNGSAVRRDGNGDIAEMSISQILRGSKDVFWRG